MKKVTRSLKLGDNNKPNQRNAVEEVLAEQKRWGVGSELSNNSGS